ncbi:MAG: purD [Thermoleophilia bacterium]|nr:purD [Thermoleophilia bacterium]
MKVLVIGSGGREHALVAAISASPSCSEVVCAPGNPGVAQLARCIATDGSVDDLERLARREAPDLVVIGPEVPLVGGLADRLRAADIDVFGPGADGAQLEGSKWHAKELLLEAGVATAKAQHFTDFEDARAFVEAVGAPIVVKADGLAAGKGVVVALDVETAVEALREALLDARFGAAGASVVLEECLEGPELSVLALVSGSDIRVLAPARDHKRAHDGDMGPNTGGMGAVCPPADADDDLLELVEREVLRPVVDELVRRGVDYRGVLYAGLMLTADGPSVIEFNVRFGDPEAQVVLPRLRGDVALLLQAAARGELADAPAFEWDDRVAVGVVVAAEGYPLAPRTGDAISLGDVPRDTRDAIVFHSGTTLDADGALRTAGGRVVTVVGFGDDVDSARAAATAAASRVHFDGAWHRSDIGAALMSPALR